MSPLAGSKTRFGEGFSLVATTRLSFMLALLYTRPAFGCWTTWAWDMRPNVCATEADLLQGFR